MPPFLSSLEVLDRKSRYEALCRGELEGTDLRLVFKDDEVKENSGINHKNNNQNKFEINVHRYCFLSSPCGVIRAALEKSYHFQELQRGSIQITVPSGTFLAVPYLLRWYYDQRISFKDALYIGDILPALWKLGDFMNATGLCEALLDFLRQSTTLRSGQAFARLIHQALDLEADAVVEAALAGLPAARDQREELEVWLDFGSSDLLHALVICETYWKSHVTLSASILQILGEYLAEMTAEHLHQMPPTLFARALARMEPGTIAESDLARVVLGYIYANIDSFDAICEVQALLMAIDFSAITKEALQYDILPRVEQLSWSLAITINDLVEDAAPVTTRCAYSARLFRLEDYTTGNYRSIQELPCRHLITWESFIQARQTRWPRGTNKFRCPYCFDHSVSVEYGDEICDAFTGDLQTRLASYHRNKAFRAEALNRWAAAREEPNSDSSSNRNSVVSFEESRAVARRKRQRKHDYGLMLRPTNPLRAVRIWDQCSPLGCDRIYIAHVSDAAETSRKAIDEFTTVALGYATRRISVRLVNKQGVLDGLDPEVTWEENGISLAQEAGARENDGDYDVIIRRFAAGS